MDLKGNLTKLIDGEDLYYGYSKCCLGTFLNGVSYFFEGYKQNISSFKYGDNKVKIVCGENLISAGTPLFSNGVNFIYTFGKELNPINGRYTAVQNADEMYIKQGCMFENTVYYTSIASFCKTALGQGKRVVIESSARWDACKFMELIDNKIYIVGRSVIEFDPKTEKFENCSKQADYMDLGFGLRACCRFGNKLAMISCKDSDHNNGVKVWLFDPVTGDREQISKDSDTKLFGTFDWMMSGISPYY